MGNNGVKSWEARALWEQIKVAASRNGDLTAGLAKVALEVWADADAGTKLSSDRSHREAFVASLVGAAAVDVAIEKLAADGELSTPEAEFMRSLNAEAALHDLNQFQKTANALQNVAQFIAKNPVAVGSIAGAVAGGAFGAYSDDDNRLRGAIRFALPGAAIGGMAGHGFAQHEASILLKLKEEEEKALKAARDAEIHALQVKKLKAQLRGL